MTLNISLFLFIAITCVDFCFCHDKVYSYRVVVALSNSKKFDDDSWGKFDISVKEKINEHKRRLSIE